MSLFLRSALLYKKKKKIGWLKTYAQYCKYEHILKKHLKNLWWNRMNPVQYHTQHIMNNKFSRRNRRRKRSYTDAQHLSEPSVCRSTHNYLCERFHTNKKNKTKNTSRYPSHNTNLSIHSQLFIHPDHTDLSPQTALCPVDWWPGRLCCAV